jgi:hypothetical protein
MRLPRTEAYNFTVERQLSNKFVVSAGYVGNQTRHGFTLPSGQLYNANQPAFVPGVSNQNLLKPYYQKFGITANIDYYCDCANANYNSLQLQATMRNYAGVTLQFNYTWQREIGDTGDDSYTFVYNRPLGWGRPDNFSNHLITIAENWDIPFGRGRTYGGHLSRPVDWILGGWMINGVTTFTSGRAFTPNIGTAPAGSIRPNTGPSGRPNVGTGDPYNVPGGQSRNQWFLGLSSGVFTVPANNQYGNLEINSLYGPIFIQQDMSLQKRFNLIGENRLKMELRAEAFNVFNHTNLGDPNNDITSPQVGQITGLPGAFGIMRRFQFAVRFDF